MIRRLLVAGAATICAACVPAPAPSVHSPAPQPAAVAAAGASGYAQQRCAACHAITLTDSNPRPDAPPLRDLFKRYARDDLRRAFINGTHVGDPAMPTFRMTPQEADALVNYLRTIDPCAQPSTDRAAMDRCFAPLR